MQDTLSFYETVRARHSVRGFLPAPLPDSVIKSVLEDAQLSPSNCNTQPWNVHIVSGQKLTDLSRRLQAALAAGRISKDFSFDQAEYFGAFKERNDALARAYYGAHEVTREDKAGRRDVAASNLDFFDAPHAAFLFMPPFGDSVRVAGDIGMYGQTLLLALAARGLGGIPQTMLGFFSDTVRESLGISDEWKLLFGISFGHRDDAAPGNSFRMQRAPIEESVTFHK